MKGEQSGFKSGIIITITLHWDAVAYKEVVEDSTYVLTGSGLC